MLYFPSGTSLKHVPAVGRRIRIDRGFQRFAVLAARLRHADSATGNRRLVCLTHRIAVQIIEEQHADFRGS